MKERIIRALHFLIGFERYLRWFSIFKITFLKADRRKHDFIFFNEMLSDDARIVVGGACTGITTVPFAIRKPLRTIVAYEPLPLNFSALNAVINRYRLSNVTTINVGLGDAKKDVEMILPLIDGTRKQGMAHIADKNALAGISGIRYEVALDRLDDRLELKNCKLHAMKIVAENFEYEIFQGAIQILREKRPFIYCELWDNENRDKVLGFIRQQNYGIYFRDGKELVPYSRERYAGKNFFFKPN